MKNCQETTQEIEKLNFESISFKERLMLKAHCIICPPCRNYFKDSKSIDKILSLRYSNLEQYTFSPDEKTDLKNRINQ